MAVLSPPRVLGATGQTLSARLLRLTDAAKWWPASPAPTVRSGVASGPAGSMGELTLVNPTTLNVNPFLAVVQGTHSNTQGAYEVPNDALVTLAVTGQHASQFRRSLVVVEVNDSEAAGVASSATTDRARLHILDGALSATSPAPLPTLPANSLTLGEIAIPPAGQTVTLTPYVNRTALRGGSLNMPTEAALLALPTAGLRPGAQAYAEDTKANATWDGTRWLWFDTQWQTYTPTVSVSASQPPVEIIYGNAPRWGRYFRKGREISVQGYFQIGTTTSYNGLNSIVRIGFPPGLQPARPPVIASGTNIAPIGLVRGVGSPVYDAFAYIDFWNDAPAANRRILFLNAGDAILQGGASAAWNLMNVGHFVNFTATYETAFEA